MRHSLIQRTISLSRTTTAEHAKGVAATSLAKNILHSRPGLCQHYVVMAESPEGVVANVLVVCFVIGSLVNTAVLFQKKIVSIRIWY